MYSMVSTCIPCPRLLPYLRPSIKTAKKKREKNMEIPPCHSQTAKWEPSAWPEQKEEKNLKKKKKKEGPPAARAGSARGNCLVPNTRTRYQQT